MTEYNKKIAARFRINGEVLSVEPYGEGHINDTMLVITTEDWYIMQKLNTNVFENPQEVMQNIEAVTGYLKKKITEEEGDPRRETLTLIKTSDGCSYLQLENGDFYRMYLFIFGAKTYQQVETPVHFYNAAKAFGRFQSLLADFPADKLNETIKDFHNTKKRVKALEEAIKNDVAGRTAQVTAEIEFALSRREYGNRLVDMIEQGRLPVRVTHNDTKYNNIMIDNRSGEGICIIDLDTVMAGSLLYDFGDSLRFGTNTALEDETDLSKVSCSLTLYESFTRGFIESAGESLTKSELELMPFSAILLTYECAIRFLTDYLNGDIYFKVHREGHNLDRARNQFKLVEDMECKLTEMQRITRRICGGKYESYSL